MLHERFRADKLIEDYYAEQGQEPEKPIDGWTTQEMKDSSMRRIFAVRHAESMISLIFVSLI